MKPTSIQSGYPGPGKESREETGRAEESDGESAGAEESDGETGKVEGSGEETGSRFETMVGKVADIEKRLGFYDLNQFTPS